MTDTFAYPPRLMRKPAAARYVGVKETKFEEWVERGEMPQPIRKDGVVFWDRQALDDAVDALVDGSPATNWDAEI